MTKPLRFFIYLFIWNTSCSQDNTRKSYNDLFPVWSIDDVWGFRVGGGVHDSYTFQCGLVGSFYFPWYRHQIEGTNGFYCLIRKTLASGVNGIAKITKRKVFTEVGLEPSNVRSPVDTLTHSATTPPHTIKNGLKLHQYMLYVHHICVVFVCDTQVLDYIRAFCYLNV